MIPSRGGVYSAGPGSDTTRRGGRDEARRVLRKGRNDGTGYASRDVTWPPEWADPALRRERESEQERERERARARESGSESESERGRERERESARQRGRAHKKERKRERERERERVNV